MDFIFLKARANPDFFPRYWHRVVAQTESADSMGRTWHALATDPAICNSDIKQPRICNVTLVWPARAPTPASRPHLSHVDCGLSG